MSVKTRKQGNSLMITVPADFKIKENMEYEPVLEDNGVLAFIPVHHNIFEENADYDFKGAHRKMGLTDTSAPVGNENVW